MLAVEPDPANFAILQRNLAPHGARARALRTGLWSHATGLRIKEDSFRDGRSWTTQVRECHPGEDAEMDAVDVPTLLAASGSPRISMLKIDIEGAEAVVFGAGSADWLRCVDNIVIELHHDSPYGDAPAAFFAAIEPYQFSVSTFGELTVCTSAT